MRWEQEVWSKDAEQASSCAVRVKAPLRPPLCSAEAGSSFPGLSHEQPEPSSGRPVSLLQLRAWGMELWLLVPWRQWMWCTPLAMVALPVVPGIEYLGPGLVNWAMMGPRGR